MLQEITRSCIQDLDLDEIFLPKRQTSTVALAVVEIAGQFVENSAHMQRMHKLKQSQLIYTFRNIFVPWFFI